MAISKEDILEAVGSMTVMELNELVKALKRSSACPLLPWRRCPGLRWWCCRCC
jgi:hypothetical protein